MTIAFIIALAFAVFTGVLCVMHIRMVCRRVLSHSRLCLRFRFVNHDGIVRQGVFVNMTTNESMNSGRYPHFHDKETQKPLPRYAHALCAFLEQHSSPNEHAGAAGARSIAAF